MLLFFSFQLADLCDAYRLTGISVASQEAKRTCFRCETFFNCKLELYLFGLLQGSRENQHSSAEPMYVFINGQEENYVSIICIIWRLD